MYGLLLQCRPAFAIMSERRGKRGDSDEKNTCLAAGAASDGGAAGVRRRTLRGHRRGVCDNLPTKYFIDEITLLPVPTKEGFKFLGWYFNDALIEQINGEQRGDITIVAKWEQEQVVEKDLIVDPNNENAYATIEEALDAAKEIGRASCRERV